MCPPYTTSGGYIYLCQGYCCGCALPHSRAIWKHWIWYELSVAWEWNELKHLSDRRIKQPFGMPFCRHHFGNEVYYMCDAYTTRRGAHYILYDAISSSGALSLYALCARVAMWGGEMGFHPRQMWHTFVVCVFVRLPPVRVARRKFKVFLRADWMVRGCGKVCVFVWVASPRDFLYRRISGFENLTQSALYLPLSRIKKKKKYIKDFSIKYWQSKIILKSSLMKMCGLS